MTTTSIHHKPLADILKRQGFLYKRIKREGAWAIYEQFRKKNGKHPEKSVGFELVRIGKHNGFTIAGIVIPPAETYPSTSMWGSHGWTYNTLAEAGAEMKNKRVEYGELEEEVADEKILEEMYEEENAASDE